MENYSTSNRYSRFKIMNSDGFNKMNVPMASLSKSPIKCEKFSMSMSKYNLSERVIFNNTVNSDNKETVFKRIHKNRINMTPFTQTFYKTKRPIFQNEKIKNRGNMRTTQEKSTHSLFNPKLPLIQKQKDSKGLSELNPELYSLSNSRDENGQIIDYNNNTSPMSPLSGKKSPEDPFYDTILIKPLEDQHFQTKFENIIDNINIQKPLFIAGGYISPRKNSSLIMYRNFSRGKLLERKNINKHNSIGYLPSSINEFSKTKTMMTIDKTELNHNDGNSSLSPKKLLTAIEHSTQLSPITLKNKTLNDDMRDGITISMHNINSNNNNDNNKLKSSKHDMLIINNDDDKKVHLKSEQIVFQHNHLENLINKPSDVKKPIQFTNSAHLDKNALPLLKTTTTSFNKKSANHLRYISANSSGIFLNNDKAIIAPKISIQNINEAHSREQLSNPRQCLNSADDRYKLSIPDELFQPEQANLVAGNNSVLKPVSSTQIFKQTLEVIKIPEPIFIPKTFKNFYQRYQYNREEARQFRKQHQDKTKTYDNTKAIF